MAVNSTSAQGEFSEYTSAARWVIMSALMLGALMQTIDTSIVNVAIPQMMGNLGATLDQIGWVTTGYIIANVIVLPLTGWLTSTFGRKRYLTTSIIIFTVASFFCGTARSLNSLVLFRVMQGVGGAALLSTAQATMMEIFPPWQLGMVQAIYGIGVMVGPTLGPTLGGWITDNYKWPWIFFINLPIGAVAAFLAYTFVHDSKYTRPKSAGVDIVGIGLLAVGLGTLQTLLEKGNKEGWFGSSLIVWLTICAVTCLVSFVIWELKTPYPAVNLRILKNRGFAAGTVLGTVLGFGLFGGTFVLPVFLQELRGYTAQQTGLIILPGAIATAIMMPVVGKLVSKVSVRTLTFIGAIGFITSMFLLHTMTLDTGPSQLFWPLVIRGASMGFLFVPLTLATLTGLKGREMADGTGLFNVSRQIGGSAGIAFLTTYLAHRAGLHRADLVSYINQYNPLAVDRIRLYEGYMRSCGFAPPVAKKQAFYLIDMIINQQAAIKSFEDAFMIVGIIFLLSLPLILLFRKGKPVTAVDAKHVAAE